jgi:hypothetical protein
MFGHIIRRLEESRPTLAKRFSQLNLIECSLEKIVLLLQLPPIHSGPLMILTKHYTDLLLVVRTPRSIYRLKEASKGVNGIEARVIVQVDYG